MRLASFRATLLLLVLAGAERPAHAEPADAPTAESTHFVPNRPLLVAGGGLLIAGYAPAAAAGLPATAGIAAGGLLAVATIGLSFWVGCVWPDSDDDPEDHSSHYHPETHGYLCLGANGGIQLLLPIAGPLLFAYNHPRDDWMNPEGRELTRGAKGWLLASSITQATGLGLVISSFIFGHREPDAAAPAPSAPASASARGPRFFVLPMVAGGIGSTLGVTMM